MRFIFEELPYSFDALEPYIDARTMEIHYTKHHKAYYDKFIAAVKGTEMENITLEQIFAQMSKFPTAVRNNGGGYYNHSLFWRIMSPEGGGEPTGSLAEAINKTFSSFESLKNQFNDAAATRFGSGWAWLCVGKNKELEICSTANQDNPLMENTGCGGRPIMGLDVWEHAYYLKYQNRRPEYIQAFWNVVNWKEVEKNYTEAISR
jgi:Fe-Mn family superoxide dismutase